MSVFWRYFYSGFAPSTPGKVFDMASAAYTSAAVKVVQGTNDTEVPAELTVWIAPNTVSSFSDLTEEMVIVPRLTVPAYTAGVGGGVVQWTGFEALNKFRSQIWIRSTVANTISVTINGGSQA